MILRGATPVATCPICDGDKWIPQSNGTYVQCECVQDAALRRYLGDDDLLSAPDLTKSILTGMIKKPNNYLIRAESSDMKMTVFKSHFKVALKAEFMEAVRQGRAPLTWKRIAPGDITGTKFDSFTSYRDKLKILGEPRLLVIVAPSFPSYKVFFKELELLMADRVQKNMATWLVCPNFDKLKSGDFEMSAQFNLLLNSLLKTNYCSLTKADTIALKADKKPVINVKRGLGLSGIDQALLSCNKAVEARISEMEKAHV